jgi:hypothetical protein
MPNRNATEGVPYSARSDRVPVRGAPEVEPYFRGKICAALALGLSQREAEAWFDVSQSTISRLVELDPTFAEKLADTANLALLHPLLRIQQASGKSWRAAAWLSGFLASRTGDASADELLGLFPALSLKIRNVLFEEEMIAEETNWEELS